VRRLAAVLTAIVASVVSSGPAFAAAGTGPDLEVVPPAGPIVISDSQPSASVFLRNNGPGTSATKLEINFDTRGLDAGVVQVKVGTNPCVRTIPGLYGPCQFAPPPDQGAVEVGFTVFTLAPVPGKSGPAGSLVVSVRFGPDSNTANNSVTIPVVVEAPPASPTPTPPSPTPSSTPSPTPPTPAPSSPSPTSSPVPAPVPTAGSGGGLPITGTQAATVGWVGLAVLVLGALLFVVARRRRVVVVAPDDER
jgi:LPXTG-motif cell wall-anchored protein